MPKTMTSTEARKNFFAMLKELETPGTSILITHQGHPKGMFIPVDDYEGWMETLDIMSDPEEVAAIREAMKEVERGEVVDYEEVKKRYAA